MRAVRARKNMPGGFGLKIMDSLAERMTITSTHDAGTEVRMKFPLVGASLV